MEISGNPNGTEKFWNESLAGPMQADGGLRKVRSGGKGVRDWRSELAKLEDYALRLSAISDHNDGDSMC